jgi:RHS repeat-associated protein
MQYFRYDGYGMPKLLFPLPFQIVHTGDAKTDRLYTGQRWEYRTRLYDYGARHYDPRLARFLTHDPVREYMNPYAYVRWNPIHFTDPTGMFIGSIFLSFNMTMSADSPYPNPDDIKARDQLALLTFRGFPGQRATWGPGQGGPSDSLKGLAGLLASSAIDLGQSFARDGVRIGPFGTAGVNTAAMAMLMAYSASMGPGLVGFLVTALGVTWNLGNTILGVTYGLLGIPTEGIGFEHGQIQFSGNLLQWLLSLGGNGAVTLGHVGIYPPGFGPETVTQVSNASSVTLGYEESFHSVQGEFLGPLYLPAHLILGTLATIWNGEWHGPLNVLEAGPHASPPRAF